jgi:nitroimidazol reductase NimA-like FMN-containing flavoprotein (pyridoxamine 5'-phosphate oxidase superfamily)
MKITGALAWNPEIAMTSAEIDEFLSGRWIARLATVGRNGYPHISPLWYYWDGECVYLELTENRQSCKNLRRDPRCSIVIDMDDRPLMGMRSNMAKAVLIIGDAEMTEVSSGRQVRIIRVRPRCINYVPPRHDRSSSAMRAFAISGV